jgi:hypothetical protein
MLEKTLHGAGLAIMIGMVIWMAIFCFGCNSGWTWPGSKPITQVVPPNATASMWSTVSRSNKLVPFAIPIIAIGAVVAFNGMAKMGMSCIIFGCVNLFMSLATSRFALWMSIFGLIGSAAAVAASILIKNKAVRELIMSAQKLKEATTTSPIDKEVANKVLAEEQSTFTQRIVQQVKLSLKFKGEL